MGKIDKEKYPFIAEMEELKNEKNLDDIADLMLHIVGMYSLDMKETSAILFRTMQATLQTHTNKTFLKERLGLDVGNLSVEGTLKIQEALVNVYIEELVKSNA